MTTKTCSKCGEVKALDEYSRNKSMEGGRLNQCKECCRALVSLKRELINARAKERRKTLSSDEALKQREYRAKNKDKVKHWRKTQKERDDAKMKNDDTFRKMVSARGKRRYESAKKRALEGMIVPSDQPKYCSVCEAVKPVTEFQLQPTGRFSYRCKSCDAEYQKQYRKDDSNRARIKAKIVSRYPISRIQAKQRRSLNPEKYRKASSKDYYDNRDQRIARVAEYLKRNPQKARAWSKKCYDKSVSTLSDAYIGKLIVHGSRLRVSEITDAIPIKRAQLTLLRVTNQLKKELKND